MDVSNTLEVGTIMMGLVGGLAIFLYGMEQMTDALKMVAGNKMKSLLSQLTTNKFKGVLAGTFVTAIIQSSSVTTVLVVGFISAGLMTLPQSIGIILGADIGTTITAQIVAFKVTHYGLVLVAFGFSMLFFLKKENYQHYGRMVMGLGLIFFGMELMSNATRPMRSYQPFISLMQSMDNPLLGILISAVFTGLVQSSSATIGVVIVLASQGFITLHAGIALAFGANIGTCVTALLATIGKPPEAVRAAVVHILFKIVGVLIWLPFIDQLASLAHWLSPASPGLEGVALLAAETPRQIANAHTIYNVGNMLIFIWFTDPLASLMRRIVPDSSGEELQTSGPMYLDAILLQTPALALDIVRMELGRLGAQALRMVRESMQPVMHGSQEDLDTLAQMDDDVDHLHGALITYLGRLSLEHLTEAQSQLLYDYIAAANYFENIGDMIETNLVEAGEERIAQDVHISESTQEKLVLFYEKICWSVERSTEALVSADKEIASEIEGAKQAINQLAEDAEAHLSSRLTANEPNRLAAFRIETEMIEYLKRVYYFSKRIAKLIVEEEMDYVRTEPEPSPAKKPQWFYIQSGVIPYQLQDGELKLMLVTGKSGKRWVIPKGVIEKDLTPRESAEKELFEEAGLKGRVHTESIGEYQYHKWGGTCNVQVFPCEISEVLKKWPDSGVRKRKWVSIKEATNMIDEDVLKNLFRQLPEHISAELQQVTE